MLQLPAIVSDAIYHIQQLVYQPASRRTAVASTTLGFTIVELLIVIVVIGILAAIVIVAFNGIQNRAYDTTVQNDMSAMVKKLEMAKINSPTGVYPMPPTTNTDIHISKNAYMDSNNLYYCYYAADNKYAVQVRSKSGTVYKIVDGAVSQGAGANGYSGLGTCQILNAALTFGGGNASLGYDTSTKTWQTWAQD